MQDIEKFIPEELKQKIAGHGLHKVAQLVFGLPDLSEATVLEHLGVKLATARIERRKVAAGLSALKELGE